MTKPECRMTKDFRMTNPKTTRRRGTLRHSDFEIYLSFVICRPRNHWTLGMNLTVPATLEAEIDELLTHYPQKRSASLMVLHAVQDHFGWISREAIEWI